MHVNHIQRFCKKFYDDQKDIELIKNSFHLIVEAYNNGESLISFDVRGDLDILENFIKTISLLGIQGTCKIFDSWKREYKTLKEIIDHDDDFILDITKYKTTLMLFTFEN